MPNRYCVADYGVVSWADSSFGANRYLEATSSISSVCNPSLCVEVDGGQHAERTAEDGVRRAISASLGIGWSDIGTMKSLRIPKKC